MSDEGTLVKGLCRIGLAQKRFKDGALYVCAVLSGQHVQAVDVRYMVEDDNFLIPTRQGFRVRSIDFEKLRELCTELPKRISEIRLWKGATRKLIARYCDDNYGTAIDIRYFADTRKYRGWEPRGIRLQLEDFAKLQLGVLSSGLLEGQVSDKSDLLKGKHFAPRPVKRGQSAVRETQSSSRAVNDEAMVNPLLAAFMAEDEE